MMLKFEAAIAVGATLYVLYALMRKFLEARRNELQPVVQSQTAPPEPPPKVFWAVSCHKHPELDDGSLEFFRCEKTYARDGTMKTFHTLERLVSRVAPDEKVYLLGDYETCEMWLQDYRELLEASIKRHTTGSPTIWKRLEDDELGEVRVEP